MSQDHPNAAEFTLKCDLTKNKILLVLSTSIGRHGWRLAGVHTVLIGQAA